MSDEDLARRIQLSVEEGVKKGLASSGGKCARCCPVCDLDPHEHRDQHQALKQIGIKRHAEDHAFIGDMRATLKQGRKVLVSELIKHSVTAMISSLTMFAVLRSMGVVK